MFTDRSTFRQFHDFHIRRCRVNMVLPTSRTIFTGDITDRVSNEENQNLFNKLFLAPSSNSLENNKENEYQTLIKQDVAADESVKVEFSNEIFSKLGIRRTPSPCEEKAKVEESALLTRKDDTQFVGNVRLKEPPCQTNKFTDGSSVVHYNSRHFTDRNSKYCVVPRKCSPTRIRTTKSGIKYMLSANVANTESTTDITQMKDEIQPLTKQKRVAVSQDYGNNINSQENYT